MILGLTLICLFARVGELTMMPVLRIRLAMERRHWLLLNHEWVPLTAVQSGHSVALESVGQALSRLAHLSSV